MKFAEGLYDLDMGEDLDSARDKHAPGLRITYKVPWCRICGNYVEKFSYEKNTPGPGKDTLVAECHGRTHTREIRSESGVGSGMERTDVFFDERSQSTFLGRDVSDKLANKDHDMAEIDGRMKSLGLGSLGDGGDIVWNPKK